MSHCTALVTVPSDFKHNSTKLTTVLPCGGAGCVLAGELRAVAKLVRSHPDLTEPIRVLWGYARWSKAQLLGELAQQEWGMCGGVASDIVAEPLKLWESTW